jgi:hypothetical protein
MPVDGNGGGFYSGLPNLQMADFKWLEALDMVGAGNADVE